ncbi:hypothetical protein AKJ57_00175 [candidate division MSBL1 archaeon SCGC-AAA259A05]|uniref:Nitroreductase n=1 Tax=candidate division MSBL1 archaeon SCGC-AAA259A05 TaxID=1698259 RepID=A0A133UC31_9EURY|nr:hypothetical protein AKJ57_00175 [candidate division MSBL1 archaeon SCGC-AAA259A05]
MDVEDAILKRRSVRSYKNKGISREKLEKIMDCARMAPSANNRQDWKFVVVDDDVVKDRIYEVANRQGFVREAPVVIAGVTTDPKDIMSCGVPAGVVDLSIAMDHLALKAADEGLGTCWIGAFNQEEAKEAIEIPEKYEVVALMTVGHPSRPLEAEEKNRKDLEEIISYNTYTE